MRGIVFLVFCRERRGAGRRPASSSNGNGQGNDKSKVFLQVDKQQAIHLMGEFDGGSGVAAFGG